MAFIVQASQAGQPGGHWQEYSRLPGQQAGEYFGRASAWIGDINGDHCDEWIAGALYADYGPGGNHGRADVVDGKTGLILRTHTGNPYDVRLGSRVAGCGDMDGDAVPDYLVSQSGSAAAAGRIFSFSGASGLLIREFVSPVPTLAPSHFGADSLDGGRDVTGDGIPEVFVGDSLFSQPGQVEYRGKVYCFDGSSGLVLWESVGVSVDDHFGLNLALVGDLQGDGIENLIVFSALNPGYGTIHILNAQTGVEEWHLIGPRPNAAIGSGIGHWPMCSVGDADLDGLPDFAYAVNSLFASDGPPSVRVVRGYDAGLIWEWQGDDYFDYFGATIASAGDLDEDGYPDVFIGQPRFQIQGWDWHGAATLYSCRDGRILRKFIGGSRNGSLGWGLAAGGDANGDGRPDLLLADPGFSLATGLSSILTYDPYLASDSRAMSAGTGATVTYRIDFPASEAGLGYRLLASSAQPGQRSVGGVAVPLMETALMHRFILRPPAAFSGVTGTLDAVGDAQVLLTLAPGAAATWIGRSLKLAAISEFNPGQPSLSSGAVFLDVLP